MSQQVDVAIIGAGTAGLNAFSQAIKKTSSIVLINEGPYGTTCARVGCMPSKVLIEVANEFARRQHFADFGIQGGEQLTLDRQQVMQYVRRMRDWFVDRVMDSVNKIGAKNIQGRAQFVEPQVLAVNGEHIRANKIIIATGSRPLIPTEWQTLGAHVITTDDFFELTDLPDTLAVVGLGAIGCEIGQALAYLGIQVVGIEKMPNICGISDPVVNKVAVAELSKAFTLHTETTARLSLDPMQGVHIQLSTGSSIHVDKVLAALGRRPNLENMGLETVFGLDLSKDLRKWINPYTMQLGDWPVFIAGDVSNYKPILHEVSDDGNIAGYNAVHDPIIAFERRVPLRIAFTEPQVVEVGAAFADLADQDILIGERSFVVQGRSKIMARTQGHLRIYVDRQSSCLLGAEMMAPDAEYMGHFLAMAIEHRMTVRDIMLTPFYHPTLLEGLDNALAAVITQLADQVPGPILRRRETTK